MQIKQTTTTTTTCLLYCINQFCFENKIRMFCNRLMFDHVRFDLSFRIEAVKLRMEDETATSGVVMTGGKDGRLKYWNVFG